MNLYLQKLFSTKYSPDQTENSESGASSIEGTKDIRQGLENLFVQYNIKSIFDSGCNDCGWMSRVIDNIQVVYHGGDISLAMVAHVWRTRPELDVQVHDATSDPFLQVDLLLVRDVAIHLNNTDKKKLWKNWLDSNTPWILITHSPHYDQDNNRDFEYKNDDPFIFINTNVNWQVSPWCFPAPIDQIWEYNPDGKCLALWHRTQIENLL
jgi:hypothetical protein